MGEAVKLKLRHFRALVRHEYWERSRGFWNEVFTLDPLVECGLLEERVIAGIGADWAEYRTTMAGHSFLARREGR